MSNAVPSPRALRRELDVAAVTALVIGEVIAVGIFLTPASMARSLGSPFLLLVVWLVMGGMAVTGALCYGELAARRPEADGGYVGSLLALFMALPRVYYAMARDSLFFKGAAVLHPRFGTPARAIGIQAGSHPCWCC